MQDTADLHSTRAASYASHRIKLTHRLGVSVDRSLCLAVPRCVSLCLGETLSAGFPGRDQVCSLLILVRLMGSSFSTRHRSLLRLELTRSMGRGGRDSPTTSYQLRLTAGWSQVDMIDCLRED